MQPQDLIISLLGTLSRSLTLKIKRAGDPPGGSVLLGEEAEDKGSLLVWLKGGGNHKVVARRQLEAAADLAHVDEGVAHGHSALPQENIRAQVDVGATRVLQPRPSTQPVSQLALTPVGCLLCHHRNSSLVTL